MMPAIAGHAMRSSDGECVRSAAIRRILPHSGARMGWAGLLRGDLVHDFEESLDFGDGVVVHGTDADYAAGVGEAELVDDVDGVEAAGPDEDLALGEFGFDQLRTDAVQRERHRGNAMAQLR